jgi:hypothetical protein
MWELVFPQIVLIWTSYPASFPMIPKALCSKVQALIMEFIIKEKRHFRNVVFDNHSSRIMHTP